MTLLNSTLDKMLIGAFGRMVKSVESSHSLHAVRQRPHYCIPLTQIGGNDEKVDAEHFMLKGSTANKHNSRIMKSKMKQ